MRARNARAPRSAGWTSASCRCPPGQDPADVAVSAKGADGVRALLARAVPFARFEVERAIERGDTRSTEGRDRVLDEVVPVIAPLPASVLREELVQLVAGRLSVTESLVASALADPGAHRPSRGGAARGGPARVPPPGRGADGAPSPRTRRR